MSAIPSIPGLTFEILVAGEPAEQYSPPADDPVIRYSGLQAHHGYIKSITGSTYSIQYSVSAAFKFPDDADVLSLSIIIDGTPFHEFALRSTDLKATETIGEIRCRTCRTSDGLLKKEFMTFGDLSGLEDADHATVNADMERIDEIGTIKIVIGSGRLVTKKTPIKYVYPDNFHRSLQLAEKALIKKGQGLTHGTTFQTVNNVVGDDDEEHLVVVRGDNLGVFVFHYRSAEPLEGQNIVPSGHKRKLLATEEEEIEEKRLPKRRLGHRVKQIDNCQEVIDLTNEP